MPTWNILCKIGIGNICFNIFSRHVDMMAKALRSYVQTCGCDKILANHALLQPLNVKRALEGLDIPFDIKIHGSAILFVLSKHPKYIPLAVEAINACNKVIAGTEHVVGQITEAFPDLDLSKKLVIIPPGMDPDVFALCTSIEENTKGFLKQVSNLGYFIFLNDLQLFIFKTKYSRIDQAKFGEYKL